MSKLDDILGDINTEAAFMGGNEDSLNEDEMTTHKQKVKDLMLELIKEEQKNWDEKDDQAMWGYQNLYKRELRHKVNDL
jgi:hypothetical protein